MKAQTSNQIVIVDDDRFAAADIALQAAGYDTKQFLDASEAFKSFSAGAWPDFLIVDMMMTPHRKLDPTESEMMAGVYLAKDVRALRPDIPIVLWTNARAESVQQSATAFARNSELVLFLKKAEVTPFALVDLVKQWFTERTLHRRVSPKTLWKRFVEAAILQPSIGGLGIDLKKFAEQWRK